jgi:hypothetical protein|tara:strand:+ start:545 stop:733 length:189 start_codon:yes stop_codon:yes gene_type:complete
MSLKKLVNDKAIWDALVEEFDERISTAHKTLESLTDTSEMYRCQGYIRSLRKLKYLRDIVNG